MGPRWRSIVLQDLITRENMKPLTRHASLLLALGALLATSCVPNRKVTYLQYEDELKHPELIVTDSIIRAYKSGQLHYELQPYDVVDIKIASPTPEEYNPFHIADPYITAGMVSGNSQNGGMGMQNRGYRIDPWGYLELPVIGKLRAAGLSIEQLEDTINILAVKQLEEPVTKVNLLNFKFSVMGEVESEGVLYSNDHMLTIVQALAMAGGIGEFGDLSRIKVIRKIEDTNYVFYVNMLEETYLSSEFYFVHPNDVLIVSPLKARGYLKYMSPNLSIISSIISLVVSILALTAVNSL